MATVPVKYLLNFHVTLKSLYFKEQRESFNEAELVECLSLSQLRLEKIREVKFNQKLKWKVLGTRITLVARATGHSFGACYFDLKLDGLRALYLGEFNDDRDGYLRPLDVDRLVRKRFDVCLLVSPRPRKSPYFRQTRLDHLGSLLEKTRSPGKSNVVVFRNLPLLLEWLMIMHVLQQKGEGYKVFLSRNLSLYIQLVKMLTEYMEYELANRICEGDQEILPKGSIQLVHFKDFLMQRKDPMKVLFIFEDQLVKSDWNKLLHSADKYNFVFLDDNNWSRGVKAGVTDADISLESESESGVDSDQLEAWLQTQVQSELDERFFDVILGKHYSMEEKSKPERVESLGFKVNASALSTTARAETVVHSIQTENPVLEPNYIQFDSSNRDSFIESVDQAMFGFNYRLPDFFGDSADRPASVKEEALLGAPLTGKFFELFREEKTDLVAQEEPQNEDTKGLIREVSEDRDEHEQNIEQKISFNEGLLAADFQNTGGSLGDRMSQLMTRFAQVQEGVQANLFAGNLCADAATQRLVYSRLKASNLLILNSRGNDHLESEEVKVLDKKKLQISFSPNKFAFDWKVDANEKIRMFSFDYNASVALVSVKVDRSLSEGHLLSFAELKTHHFWILKKNFLLGFLSFLKNSEFVENKYLEIHEASVSYKGRARLVKEYQRHPVLEGNIGPEFVLLRQLLYKYLGFA